MKAVRWLMSIVGMVLALSACSAAGVPIAGGVSSAGTSLTPTPTTRAPSASGLDSRAWRFDIGIPEQATLVEGMMPGSPSRGDVEDLQTKINAACMVDADGVTPIIEVARKQSSLALVTPTAVPSSSSTEDASSSWTWTADITCTHDDGSTESYTAFRDAWSSKLEAETSGAINNFEVAALERAYGAGTTDYDSLGVLVGICSENSPAAFADTPWTKEQVDEQMGALVLCPDHPQRAAILKSIATAAAAEKAAAAEEALRVKGLFPDECGVIGSGRLR
ncbi:hypothetical protein [Terrabacter terrigena]|uniref:DUF732 domain-containing protein n=1 Tax=Terrabacter terrigena TaxID=574718 RepID=A0ABW3N2C4_9MICO